MNEPTTADKQTTEIAERVSERREKAPNVSVELPIRPYPKLKKTDEGEYHADCPEDFNIERLLGMRTHEAAHGPWACWIASLSPLSTRVDSTNIFLGQMNGSKLANNLVSWLCFMAGHSGSLVISATMKK